LSAPRAETPPAEPGRMAGLDTLRFVAAAVVTMGHLGVPPLLAGLERSHPIAWFISASYGVSMNGPAAVIVFFVISGLCIHHPSIDERPHWPRYFVRRYVRIGIPLLASIGFSLATGIPYVGLSASILWSLQCELIYYTLYPLLLLLRDRFGWKPLILGAFVLSYATVGLVDPRALSYPSYGWALNWLVGLPCWLLGCELAERVRERPARLGQRIWYFRLAVWLASAVALALRFHSPVGYPWSLNLFAVLVYFWLLEEIPHLAAAKVPRWTEKLGFFSYSLYLVHLGAWELYKKYYRLKLGPLLDWTVLMGFVLIVSYLFFLAFEAPSQRLARRIANALRPRRAAAPAA
jgi:peptidoglycan/LPS O-acetylase OafA/YrhL